MLARSGSPKCACSKIARTSSLQSLQRGKIQRWQSISCKGKLRLLRGGERFRRGVGQCVDFGGVLVKPKARAAVKNRREADPFQALLRHG